MKSCFAILFAVCCYFGSSAQIITTIAGNGVAGYSGDGGTAVVGEVNGPDDIATDNEGNIYIADELNYCVRKVNALGVITTFAGTGTAGYSGDFGPATLAQLRAPQAVAVDTNGNVYIADNNVVRKVNTLGIITLFAGTGTSGYSGDGGPATLAMLSYPHGLAADRRGNIYIANATSNHICKVDAAGIITNFAGTGAAGYSGDGTMATDASIHEPFGMCTDTASNVYFADCQNHAIRKISASGIITTISGNGSAGFSGDGLAATTAQLRYPTNVTADRLGNIYILDNGNERIRLVSASGTINTFAGTGIAGFTGDGYAATAAEFNNPYGICLDTLGNLYFCDGLNERIRKISNNHTPTFSLGHTQTISLCTGSGADTINALLAANDIDYDQPETWSIISTATHGVLAAAYTGTSTGGGNTPAGMYYTPATGYTGPDSFKVQITDCMGAADTIKVYVNVLPLPFAATISGPDSVCIGATITLADTATGGAWQGSNASALVSGAVVTGLAAGTDTIAYVVTNTCGADTAAKTIVVHACVNGVDKVTNDDFTIHVFPNPGKGKFSISCSPATSTTMHIVITSSAGAKVKEITAPGNKPVDVEIDVPAGVYFISATAGQASYTGKLEVGN